MHWIAIVTVLVLLVVVGRVVEGRRQRRLRARREALAEACHVVAQRLQLGASAREGAHASLRGTVGGQLVRLTFTAPEAAGPPALQVEVEPGVPAAALVALAPSLAAPLEVRRDRIVADLGEPGDAWGADRLEALVRDALEAGQRARTHRR